MEQTKMAVVVVMMMMMRRRMSTGDYDDHVRGGIRAGPGRLKEGLPLQEGIAAVHGAGIGAGRLGASEEGEGGLFQWDYPPPHARIVASGAGGGGGLRLG